MGIAAQALGIAQASIDCAAKYAHGAAPSQPQGPGHLRMGRFCSNADGEAAGQTNPHRQRSRNIFKVDTRHVDMA